MAAHLVQLFSFLFLLWPVAAEFPAGPGWEWVSSMAKMGGKEFGEVAEPLVKMNHNVQVYPEITPIEGWALSGKVEPLWQVEGEGALALVYEEVVEAAQIPRAVIAFRGHAEGNVIDLCAFEVLYDNPEDMNTTLVSWCYATYNASTFDYYSQAVAYTMRVLESYAASSVLLCGTSMGGDVGGLDRCGSVNRIFHRLTCGGLHEHGKAANYAGAGCFPPRPQHFHYRRRQPVGSGRQVGLGQPHRFYVFVSNRRAHRLHCLLCRHLLQ